MLLQLEREFLQADLAQVRALLLQSPPDEDPIKYFQFTHRVRELEQRLAVLPAAIEAAPTGIALFFGGRPVIGSHGIKANFGTKAVGYFQKLVSQRYASDEQGPLASRGRVPLAEETQLLVTVAAGQIVGWTEYSHRFELRLHDGSTIIAGSVAREAMDRAIQEGLNPLHRHFRVSLKVREVRARNRPPKLAYALLGMEPADAPGSWPTAKQQTL